MKYLNISLLLSLLVPFSAGAVTCPDAYQIDMLGAESGYVKFSVKSNEDIDYAVFYIDVNSYPLVADIAKIAYAMNEPVKFTFTGANNCTNNQMEDNAGEIKSLFVTEMKIL